MVRRLRTLRGKYYGRYLRLFFGQQEPEFHAWLSVLCWALGIFVVVRFAWQRNFTLGLLAAVLVPFLLAAAVIGLAWFQHVLAEAMFAGTARYEERRAIALARDNREPHEAETDE